MKKFSQTAAAAAMALLGAAALALSAGPGFGQMDSSAPIVVKQSAPTPAKVWLIAEVVHVDTHSIVVREEANQTKVHTFTFAPALAPKMQKILSQGGFQHGDKVKIQYVEGQTQALAIHGKPSKAKPL